MSNGIRVIGERSNNPAVSFSVLFKQCGRVFFLGLGYAEKNLNGIDIPEIRSNREDIYGAAKGMTEKEIAKIKAVLKGIFQKEFTSTSLANHRIEDKTCYKLLREYL